MFNVIKKSFNHLKAKSNSQKQIDSLLTEVNDKITELKLKEIVSFFKKVPKKTLIEKILLLTIESDSDIHFLWEKINKFC